MAGAIGGGGDDPDALKLAATDGVDREDRLSLILMVTFVHRPLRVIMSAIASEGHCVGLSILKC